LLLSKATYFAIYDASSTSFCATKPAGRALRRCRNTNSGCRWGIQVSQNEHSPGKLNVAEIAWTYEVPVTRLRRRLQGRQSKQERLAQNCKLSVDQELAVCQYLDRLDTIGTSA